jgi:hypothetical protein
MIVWGALMASQVGIIAFLLFVMPPATDGSGNEALQGTLDIAAAVYILMSLPLSVAVFRKLIRKAENTPDMAGKLSEFSKATILKGAILEGGTMLGIVSWWLSGSDWLLGFVAAVLLLMLLQFPTRRQAAAQLGISEEKIP